MKHKEYQNIINSYARYPQMFEHNFIYRSGSRLYGYANENSDYDFRGVYVLPKEAFLSHYNTQEQLSVMEDNEDWVMYSLHKMMCLYVANDPVAIESLFVSDDDIVKDSPLRRDIKDLLMDKIISKVIYKRLLGFANSEWRKARGERVVLQKPSVGEQKAKDIFQTEFKVPKFLMKDIMNIIDERKPIRVESSISKLGKKKKAEFDKYGYGVSSACHCIRLTIQAINILNGNYNIFPNPEVDVLRKIKRGMMPFDEVNKLYEYYSQMSESAFKKSSLRDRPDVNGIWEWYDKTVLNLYE